MPFIASRLDRIQPSPSSMAGQRARELRASGRDIVGLTAGEPDFETPANICEAATRAMYEQRTKYTDVGGTPELKAAIREKFCRENGLDYAAQEVVVGTGAKQIIFNALLSTLEPGDEVIVSAPYWVSYPDIVKLADATPVIVNCAPQNGFKLVPEQLERAITARTKWVILNSPNNPSGAVYAKEELAGLAAVLARHPRVWVLSDDIYEHLIYDGVDFGTIAQVAPELKARTLTVNGVSKAYAMTGWRIGYAGGPAVLINAMTKLQSQSTSNPSSISQAAAVEALSGPQQMIGERRSILQTRRDHVVAQINTIAGLHCHRPEGAFYVFPSCASLVGKRTPNGRTIETDQDFVMHLLDSVGLAVLQGNAYGVSPYFRISFASPMPVLVDGLKRLAAAVATLK